jgi:hypothetical protein
MTWTSSKQSAAKHGYTEGPYREYAADVGVTEECYRTIEGGSGSYRSGGFCITGFINPEDSRLLAAAPELLESLLNAMNLLRIAGFEMHGTATDRMKSAVEKATGRPWEGEA